MEIVSTHRPICRNSTTEKGIGKRTEKQQCGGGQKNRLLKISKEEQVGG